MRLAALLLAVALSSCTLGQAKVAAYAGTVGDLATTQMALNSGLKEANPLMAVNGEPVLTSAAISVGLFSIAGWAEKHDPSGAAWFYRWVAFMRGGLAVWNTTRILRHHHNAPPVSAGMTVRF